MDVTVSVRSAADLAGGVDSCVSQLKELAAKACGRRGVAHEEVETYFSTDLAKLDGSRAEMEVLPSGHVRVVLAARSHELQAYSFYGNVVLAKS